MVDWGTSLRGALAKKISMESDNSSTVFNIKFIFGPHCNMVRESCT